MNITTPSIACKIAASFLAILKDQAKHKLAMPNASLRAYSAFSTHLEATMALCATEAPTVDDCAKIEAFLSDVVKAVLDGEMFPEESRHWKQAFLDAIEIAGMSCAEVTGSLEETEPGRDPAATLH